MHQVKLRGNMFIEFKTPVFGEQKTAVASLADKEAMPCSALAKNGASGIKQTDLSVRLVERHRRGSAPMFIVALGIIPNWKY